MSRTERTCTDCGSSFPTYTERSDQRCIECRRNGPHYTRKETRAMPTFIRLSEKHYGSRSRFFLNLDTVSTVDFQYVNENGEDELTAYVSFSDGQETTYRGEEAERIERAVLALEKTFE